MAANSIVPSDAVKLPPSRFNSPPSKAKVLPVGTANPDGRESYPVGIRLEESNPS